MPGAIHAPFAVFTQTYNRTMPLIYSGQEEPILRPIAFFEKDPMEFAKYQRASFYSTLLQLRKNNAAFSDNAQFKRLSVDHPAQVMAYERANGKDQVIVVLNLSAHLHEVKVSGTNLHEGYQEIFTKEVVKDIHQLNLPAWGYKVFVKKSAKK
jgi:glycosidase